MEKLNQMQMLIFQASLPIIKNGKVKEDKYHDFNQLEKWHHYFGWILQSTNSSKLVPSFDIDRLSDFSVGI